MIGSVLSIQDYKSFQDEFTQVETVDKSVGANIGAVWRELLSLHDETVFKVSGFVARGSNIYALVSDTYEDTFNVIKWVSEKLSFRPKMSISPFNYQLIFGEGSLPRSIEEVLDEIRSVRGNRPVSPVVESVGDYVDDFGATTVLSDEYMNLSGSGFSFDVFDEGDEYTIGRGSHVDFRVVSTGVSRNHCKLRYLDGIFQVFDLGSTNGTRVNGTKIPSHTWFTVSDRSTLKVGKVSLSVNRMEDM